jgi:AraC-like DNA-binding protein
MANDHRWMETLMGDCQRLAGRFSDTSVAILMAEINRLVANLPSSLSQTERLIIGGVLSQFLAHFVRQAGIDNRADLGQMLLAFADAGATFDSWRTRWFEVADCCVAAFGDKADTPPIQVIDARVTRMRRSVEARYADPGLNAREMAKTVSLSPCHASRMLKQQTGFGFVAHLHRCRIAVARDLLTDSALSIKEIAAAVGYAHPSQLSRQFKLACRVTPLAFRAARINRRPALADSIES